MIEEIQAKVLLSHVKQPDRWFGLKYNMNLYRGCQHRCIYCDSRSACYQIENFDRDVLVKVNAIQLLRKELSRKRVRGTIGTGSMNDPYMPVERTRKLTRRALEVIASYRFPVHVITKSDLVIRDLDILQTISQIYATVSFTITTTDDALAKKIEPGAPSPTARLRAIETLTASGIQVGVTLQPVLPFITDNEENIRQIVLRARESGAAYIIPSFGMTLRDRQRAFFYERLDERFPGLRSKYERQFGGQYFAPADQIGALEAFFNDLCARTGIAPHILPYAPAQVTQLKLF